MSKYLPKKILTIISIVAVFVVAGGAAVMYTNIIKDAWEFHVFKEANKESPKLEPTDKELYKPVETYEDAVTGAVELASQSVVAISATKDIPLLENCIEDPFSGLPVYRASGGHYHASGRVLHILDRNRAGKPSLQAKLLIELIAAHTGEVISTGLKEEGFEQTTRALDRRRLARAEPFVCLDQGLVL